MAEAPINPKRVARGARPKKPIKVERPFLRKWHWEGGKGPNLELSLVQPLWIGGAVVAIGWTIWQISMPSKDPNWVVTQISVGASALGAFVVAVIAAAALVNLGTGVYSSLLNKFGQEDVNEANMTWVVPIAVGLGIVVGLVVWK